MNYSEHSEVLEMLRRDQHADQDNRELLQEELDFLYLPGGQWESTMWEAFNNRPRYTFDQCWPQINKAWSEMAANEYAATIQPLNGEADEDKAQIIDGLIRSIYSASSFDDISTRVGKRLIGIGEGALRVIAVEEQRSFHKELRVAPLTNSHERVWFDCDSILQTREDAGHVTIVTKVYLGKLKEMFPDRERFTDVAMPSASGTSGNKPGDQVAVGEILYKKISKDTIYMLNDNEGTVVDSKYLLDNNIGEDSGLVLDSKEVDVAKVYSRKFDNEGWLEDEKETVFDLLPVIPFYAHFDVIQDKVVYHGLVRPIMDSCRVINYSESRKVEDSILSIPEILWVTDEQAEGKEDKLARLNRSPQRVSKYNHVDGQTPPHKTPGAMPSAPLTELSQGMMNNVQITTGLQNVMADAQMSGTDSDFRFNQRSSIGQMGTYEYYRSYSVGLEQVVKVIVGAIPNSYDAKRAIKTINESGKSSEVTINDKDDGGNDINDLTVGSYDVSVSVAPSRSTRQSEANAAIMDAGKIIPGLIERNTDVLTNNIDAPGMNTVSARERNHLMAAGVIPDSEWTDSEKQQAQLAAQQPKEKTPEEKIGDAELRKSESMAMKAEYEALAKQAQLEQQERKQEFDEVYKVQQLRLDRQAQEIQELKTLTESMLNIAKAFEASASPAIGEVIQGQAQLTIDQQRDIETNLG